MRIFGVVIVLLAAIAVCLVHIRRAEVRMRYQAHRLECRAQEITRQLANQQVCISRLTCQSAVRRRVATMGLALVGPDSRRDYLAARGPAARRPSWPTP